MLKIMIPRFKCWKSAPAGETSYPNLQDDADGVVSIPEAYGVLKNVTPICIDTTIFKFKFSRRGLHAIDAIRNAGVTLVLGTDYTVDLANGEFTLSSTPYLAANTLYYFVLEATWPIDGTNYLAFKKCETAGYAGGQAFTIDGAGVWTPDPTVDLLFRVRGRATLASQDITRVDTTPYLRGAAFPLRNVAGRTRIAQSFMTGASPFYLTHLQFWTTKKGNPPASNIRATILSAYNPAEVQVGVKSSQVAVDTDLTWWSFKAYFPLQSDVSNLVGDIQGLENLDTSLMENVADVLKDIYINIIGGTAAGINAADLATLKAARIQDVALYLADEAEFDQTKQILEAGHLFKFLPSLAGDFAVRCLTSGEPAGTPHLKAQHVKNFTMRRIWSNVFHVTKIKYYQDSTTGDWLMAEAKSDIARYLYNRQESIEIETALKDAADAVQAAKDYLGTDPGSTRKVNLQYPTRVAEFDVLAGYGFDLIPTMKVKLTLPRADYAGGVLNGILFRILEVHKNGEDRSSHLVTLLDSLTY